MTDTIMQPGFFEYNVRVLTGCNNATEEQTDPAVYDLPLTGYVNTQLDGLFKSIYSMFLTDLGQREATNILAHPRLIMQLQQHSPAVPISAGPAPVHVFENETTFFDWFGPMKLFHDLGSTIANPLRGTYHSDPRTIPIVLPAVISTQYFCQTPQLKSTGSLLVAIIVADLVFLQVLWKALNFAVTFGLTRRHCDAQYCEGCSRKLDLPLQEYTLVDRMEEQASDDSPQAKIPDVEIRKRSTS